MTIMTSIIKKACRQLCRDLRRIWLALLLLVLYAIPAQLYFHTICPFAILTGYPCPACGLTRAGLCLLRGDLAAAWETHPLIFFWTAWILYLLSCRYLADKKARLAMPLAIPLCLATLFFYVFRLVSGYPTEIPYTSMNIHSIITCLKYTCHALCFMIE